MVDVNHLNTVQEVYQEAAKEHADKPAFTCMGTTLSYAEVDRYADQFASYLQNHTNLQPGDRVAVQLPNILQYPVVLVGIFRAGMVVVNTNPLYTTREINHQLNDSGAKVLVVLSNVAATAAEIIQDTEVEQVIVTNVGDLLGSIKGPLVNFVAKRVKKMVPAFHFQNSISFRSVLALGAKSMLTPVAVKPEDIAVLQYTGGTTGLSKGAMLTHSNLVSNMQQIDGCLGSYFEEGKEVAVAPLPLYHIYGFTMHCMMHYALGNHSILIPNPRDIPSFIKALKPYQVTAFVGLNTLFNSLCQAPEFSELDFSKLKVTSSGGMALTSDVAELWKKVTGCPVAEGYGLTETSPVVSFNMPDDIHSGSVGRAVINTEVKVIDGEGNTLPSGERGELCVRGPQVMKGYWKRPEATAEVIDEAGWFKTGDVATIDEEGIIRIVDRIKDMVIVSGFNVYPNEIEDEVGLLPGVLEAAVIGIEDAKSGEAVKLFVVKSDPNLTEDEIKAYCREKLTAYKVPKVIEFRDDLPKSNVGKILRKDLR